MYDPKEYFEVALAKPSIVRKESNRPGPVFIDITFTGTSNNDFDTLLFQNFYTASISIVQQNAAGLTVFILENYQLMDSPYAERGSQSWFMIKSSEFNPQFQKGKPFRILLFQPAAQWYKFEIRQIKALNKTGNAIKNSVNSDYNYSIPKSKNTLDSISETLWSDFRVLKEAAKAQINMVDSFSTDYVSADRKAGKKKDKKKTENKRGSVSAPVAPTNVISAVGALQSGTVSTSSAANLPTVSAST